MTYPIEIIGEARRTGYYRNIGSGCLLQGQKFVEDQMTGQGWIEGAWDRQGGVIGYYAYIEMWTGYKATIYMTVEEIAKRQKRGNPENFILSELIKTKAIQNYQGEIKDEQPEQSVSNY